MKRAKPAALVILSEANVCAPSASICVVEGSLAAQRDRGLRKASPPRPLFSGFADPLRHPLTRLLGPRTFIHPHIHCRHRIKISLSPHHLSSAKRPSLNRFHIE